jgi:hypothetical protein
LNIVQAELSEKDAWQTSSSTGIFDDDQPQPARASGSSAARDQGTVGQSIGEAFALV